jgi:hypothetical protein
VDEVHQRHAECAERIDGQGIHGTRLRLVVAMNYLIEPIHPINIVLTSSSVAETTPVLVSDASGHGCPTVGTAPDDEQTAARYVSSILRRRVGRSSSREHRQTSPYSRRP